MLMGVRVRHFGKNGLIIYVQNIFQMGSRNVFFGINLSEIFQIQKCDAATDCRQMRPVRASSLYHQGSKSLGQSCGRQSGRATRRNEGHNSHLPCFKQPKYPQNCSKMEKATNTFSSFASVKIVPVRTGQS